MNIIKFDISANVRLEEAVEQAYLNVIAECLAEAIQELGHHAFAMTLLSDDFIAKTFKNAA
jgi:hypothetical protein